MHERAVRPNRHAAVKKKVLTSAFKERLDEYITVHLPILRAHWASKGYVETLKPDKLEGEDAFSLCGGVDPSAFRRQYLMQPLGLKKPFGWNAVRTVLETVLKEACKNDAVLLDLVQIHMGHSKEVSLKHYQGKGLPFLERAFKDNLPGL